MNTVTVHSETTQETYRVRLIAPGDRYGLEDRLKADRALVEFRDVTPSRTLTEGGGRFVARYELSTLLDRGEGRGLDLEAGATHGKIDAKALDQALTGLLAGRRDLP